ncbi:MAG: acetyl-CoA carboxylase biotin carboxyl carrier protein [Firmicutes bacterium]|nr:acetyl-CoA carboxylase biotin carboxyl carrier protein [Bacillota bacterium]
MRINYNLINKIIDIAEENNLDELAVGWKDFKVKIKRGAREGIPVYNIVQAGVPQSKPSGLETLQEKESFESNLIKVTSPLAGIFYAAPRPGVEPFVKLGEEVEPGKTLCIIEAMKLMNEITSEVHGKIASIKVHNAQVVEAGQVLFLIEPL